MNESTVNISDFYCRGMKGRPAHNLGRSSQRPVGMFVLEGEPNISARTAPAVLESCAVFDIGLARAAQRVRNRTVVRPLPMQRRGKVLRFNIAEFDHAAAHATQVMIAQPRSTGPDSPLDFPPAA